MSHWTILGNGVTGLCLATLLIENNEKVTVIYDDTRPSASWFAGGMLAPWCEAESSSSNLISLGKESITWWKQHVSNVVHSGTLVVAPARDIQELHRFARMTKNHQWITPSTIEPELKERFLNGLFFSHEAHLNPRLVLAELQKKLIQQGVIFNTRQLQNKHIIDCRGIYAMDELPSLRAVRGEMLILHSKEIQFFRPIRLLHPRFPCYLVPRQSGYFMLGSTMIESADTSAISARSMMELLSAAYTIHPALAEARIVESSTSLRPAYSNNLPKIFYKNGIFYLNGMYRHGFLLAPIMAKRMIRRLSKGDLHEY